MTGYLIISLMVSAISMMICSTGFAGDIVPNTFSAGDTVSASRMNQNFEALENAVEGAMGDVFIAVRQNGAAYETSSWAVSDVMSIQCNSGELLTGGMCSPSHPDRNADTTNLGYVVSCAITPTAVIGFSAAIFDIADTGKYGPAITVQAVCASALPVGDILANRSSRVVSTSEPTLTEEDEMIIERMHTEALQYQQILNRKLAQ